MGGRWEAAETSVPEAAGLGEGDSARLSAIPANRAMNGGLGSHWWIGSVLRSDGC